MLETYGKDKGVRRAFKILKELGEDDFEITLIGGPNEKIDEIKNDFKNYKGELTFNTNTQRRSSISNVKARY